MKSRAILVISCDKYSDLWMPFFTLFWKNWPNCKYKVYLGGNTKKYTGDKKVTTVLSGQDVDWSTSFKKILIQIPEQSILVWPDDAFLTAPFQNKYIDMCFNFLEKNKAKNIHFRSPPQPSDFQHEFIGIYEKGIPYRVNLEGFWNKKYLTNILIEGESPWNFEIMGSYRTSFDEGFYCTKRPLFEFIHMVEKGKFIRSGVKFCHNTKIPLDLKQRKVLSFFHDIYNAILRIYVDFMFSINWRIRLKIMNFIRKILVSY